jgi:hypothetical protein
MASRVPEPGSLYAIIRQYPRTRLHVHPKKWTSDQLQLLGCQFYVNELQDDQKIQSDAAARPSSPTPRYSLVLREYIFDILRHAGLSHMPYAPGNSQESFITNANMSKI